MISLAINNRPNHLHGGIKGFDKVVWEGRASGTSIAVPNSRMRVKTERRDALTVVYTLTDDALNIEYDAIADRDTVVNLTNHSYFNLKGAGEGDIL